MDKVTKQKKLNVALKSFEKKNPQLRKSLELFNMSYKLYKTSQNQRSRISTSNKTYFKSFYIN